MIKNFGKLKQWTGERLGQAKATLQTEDFQQLVIETENRRSEFEKVHEATEQVFHQLTKKKPSPEDNKTKCSHWEALANCWISYGKTFPDDSLLGTTLINFGQTQGRLASFGDMFTYQLKDGYMITLQQGLQLYKDYSALKKKLESRRLVYDASLSKLQKSKKEKPEFEQEMQAAKIKYEESEYDLIQKMVAIQEYEEEQYNSLLQFMEAQLSYHQQVVEIITDLHGRLSDSITTDTKRQQQNGNHRPTPGARSYTAPPNIIMNENNNNDDAYGSPLSSTLSSSPVSSSTRQQRPPPPPGVAAATMRKASVDSFHQLRHASSRSSFNSYSNDDQQQQVSNQPTKLPPPSYPRRKSSTGNKKLRKAIFDFQAESNDELSFNIGDIITVVEPVDEGWWWGEIDNNGLKQKGIFPVSYTEDYQPPQPPSMPSRPITTMSVNNNNNNNLFSDHQSIQEEPYREEELDQYGSSPFESTPSSTVNNNNNNNKFAYIRPTLVSRSSSTSSTSSPSISRASTPSIATHTKPTLSNSSSTRVPPPPPPSSSSSLNRANTVSVTKSISSSRTPPPPPPSRYTSSTIKSSPSPQQQSMIPSCQECDCDDYSANLFKKGYCNNCFHKHD
ncbi:hypothetical protein BJ944DRAFT_244227 [Cunninghamella echinulata]|nr:hypothetical protein BJ944DRAFT_244227 [Cunninghamella echinulata]